MTLLSLIPLLSLFPLSLSAAASSSSNQLPSIDFAALGSVALVGSFDGISLYNPSSPSHSFSPSSSSLISRSDPSSSIQNFGSTDPGGSIDALCSTGDGSKLFIGGNFTSFGGVQASNVGVWDVASLVFSSLGSGLDGPVLALDCSDSTTVYIGGKFSSPLNPSSTGKNVAAWSIAGSAWVGLPLSFEGLDGPVDSLSTSQDGRSLFFGGSFTTSFTSSSTTNSTTTIPPTINITTTSTTTNMSAVDSSTVFASLGSSLSPISLNGSDIWGSPTTYQSGFGLPQYTFCPRGADGVGSSWLLVDGAQGFFISRFYRPLTVKGIRLGNTFYGGRGTRDFSFVSIPDNTVQTLTYSSNPLDPTSSLSTCSTSCVLSHNASVPYQDFLFATPLSLTGFQLNLDSFYGAGAGLHLIQLLSEGGYDSAVAANNLSPCTTGLGTTAQSQVESSGNWTTVSVVSTIAGTYQNVSQVTVQGGTTPADGPSLTWTPTVVQDGEYQIFITTPGCQQQDDCDRRTLSSVQVIPGAVGGDSQVTTTVVDQRTELGQSVSIFNGTLFAQTGVRVILTLGQGGAPNQGTVYDLVADTINLVAASSFGAFNSTTSNTTYTNGSTITNSTTVNTPVSGVGLFELPLTSSPTTFGSPSSLANATNVDVLASQFVASPTPSINVVLYSSNYLFLGGTFAYSGGAVTSTNFIAFSTATGVLGPNHGLVGGEVTSLVDFGGYLYAAGSFTGTSDGTVTGLKGFARWKYSSSSNSWEAIGSSTLPSTLAGNIKQLAVGGNGTIIAVGNGGQGLAYFDTTVGGWNGTEFKGLFSGNLSVVNVGNGGNGTIWLAGNIAAVADTVAPGGAILKSSNGVPALTPFGFQLNQNTSSSSTTSTTTTTSSREKREIAGIGSKRSLMREMLGFAPRPRSLEANNVVHKRSVASDIVLLSALSSSSAESQVLAGAYWKNGSTTYLVLGGKFTASNGISNLGLYDLDQETLEPVAGEAIEGSVGVVTIVGDTAWLGGNFSTGRGKQGLSTYDLKEGKVTNVTPPLQGYTGSTATVSAIAQRPGYASQIIVAGSFATAGSLSCQSICSWDSEALQWSSLGTGLQGAVGAIAFAGTKSQILLAAGSFTINGTTTYLAQWNYGNETWSLLGSASDIPGPATAVSADGTNGDKIFVAGQTATSNLPFFTYWNGTAWTDINQSGALQSGSGIQQLVFVPLTNNHQANSIIESDRMLMVSGDLNINSSTISSALFDGTSWYPYLVASSTSGTGVISQFFYSVTDFTLAGKHLSVGIVILISIAIGLGIVFLLVLIGLIVALARREEESAYPVAQPRETTDDPHITHRPTSLLATVGAATAVMLDSKGEKSRKGVDHDSIAGPLSFDGGLSYESHGIDDTITRARYSFHAEHAGELSVSAGTDVTILDSSDSNWWLIADSSGQRGLVPASYLC